MCFLIHSCTTVNVNMPILRCVRFLHTSTLCRERQQFLSITCVQHLLHTSIKMWKSLAPWHKLLDA